MAFMTLTDIVYGSTLSSAAVNSIFAEIENVLNGTTAVNVAVNGDILVPTTGYVYLGTSTSNGSVRISNSSGDVVMESRVAGTWTEIARFSASGG